MRNKSNCHVIEDFEQIKETIDMIGCQEISKKLNPTNKYLYIEKIFTFADIITSGKYCYEKSDKEKKESFNDKSIEARAEKNILFYTKKDEMFKFEKKNKKEKKFFCETKQSNINMPGIFYNFLNIGNPRKGSYSLNGGKYHSFLVNSCIKDCFEKDITNSTFQKLGKNSKAKDVNINYMEEFTKIDVHTAVHGLGTKKDVVFHSLRGNIFAKDTLCVLVEKCRDEYNTYFMIYRNPKFYQIHNRSLPVFLLADYSETHEGKVTESRKGQSQWRNELAKYSLTLNIEDTFSVKCPFTKIEVNYPSEATLLRASHIKAYADCINGDGTINKEEAYNIDNGFLVTANVDALFDKYLITVNPDDSSVIKSKTVTDDLVYNNLGVKRKIDSIYITEKKKEFLRIHYNIFIEKERKRIL